MSEEQNRTLQDKFMLRFPDGMREEVRDHAELNGRSMNAEIIFRLKQAYVSQDEDSPQINVPVDVYEVLSRDADIRHTSVEKIASEILRATYENGAEYTSIIKDYARKVSEIHDQYEEINSLKEHLNTDFFLYYNKVMQFKQFLVSVISNENQGVPDYIVSEARELRALTEAELSEFRGRYEESAFSVRRKENKEKIMEEYGAHEE